MKRKYNEEDDLLDKIITGVIVFYFFYLLLFYFTNRTKFWHWLGYGFAVAVIIIGGLIGFRKWKQKRQAARLSKLLEQIRNKGQEDYIDNFISRFGFEGKKGKGWTFRNHFFEWERITDFEKVLREKGILLRHDEKQKDIFTILRHYIQKREEKLTRESIRKEPQKFVSLTGSDFEKLIYRLFQAMGYSVECVGKSGDQGGDLIANKDGERTLIQAKCYRDWSTGNAAVQQVVGAMKLYDCQKAMVVTTSYFTSEAIALAKANNTELVSKARLQELLMEYLQESWS